MENSETLVWIDFALACKYISTNQHKEIVTEAENIGRLLHHMINNPEKYQGNNKRPPNP